VAAKGLGTAPAYPAAVAGGASRQQQGLGGGSPTKPSLGRGTGAPLRHASLPPSMAGIGSGPVASAAGAVDGTTTPPTALLPDVVTDHASGLAILRTWSCKSCTYMSDSAHNDSTLCKQPVLTSQCP
jgi:hypothetical protein